MDDFGYVRGELLGVAGRRRRWSRDEKGQIISESFAPGASVSEVARRHGMSLGLLHHWRRLARQSAEEAVQSFVPLLPSEPRGLDGDGTRINAGIIEIEIGGAQIRLRGAVDGASLASVLAAVRGR